MIFPHHFQPQSPFHCRAIRFIRHFPILLFFFLSIFILPKHAQWVAADTTKAALISHPFQQPYSHTAIQPSTTREQPQHRPHFIFFSLHLVSHPTRHIHGQRRLQRSPLAERTRRLQLNRPSTPLQPKCSHGLPRPASAGPITMDFLLFFSSRSAAHASEPLRPKSSAGSTYNTSHESKPRHRKALFDRLPDSEPRWRSMSRAPPIRPGSDASGVGSLDLILLLHRHRHFS